MDFNNLDSTQQATIAGGADIFHGLGGNDVVTLPNKANYNESVGNGQTLGWTDSAASPFTTGSIGIESRIAFTRIIRACAPSWERGALNGWPAPT